MRRILLYPAHTLLGVGVVIGIAIYYTVGPIVELLHMAGEEAAAELAKMRKPEDA